MKRLGTDPTSAVNSEEWLRKRLEFMASQVPTDKLKLAIQTLGLVSAGRTIISPAPKGDQE